MKNIFLLTTVLFCSSIFAFGQYQKGEIRLLNGESIAGYIAHDTDVELKKRVHFKESLGKTAYETYSPNEIAGFAFEKDASSYKAIRISYLRDQITFTEKSFAKLVAKGAIDLYLSQTKVEENEFVFYALKDGRLHQLVEYSYALDPDRSEYLPRSNYEGILNALTIDCRNRIGPINHIPFTRKHIVQTIDDYNACRDPDYKPLENSYQVAQEKRYFMEFFSGPIMARRSLGNLNSNDQIVERETFLMVGVAGQIEIFKPSLSRNLLVHNSLEAYKWIAWQESGVVNAPELSLAYNISAHYVFTESARTNLFTRIGGTFILDIGRDVIPTPGISFGLGAYFPSGGRLDLQYNAMSILGSDGISSLRLGYAIPLGSKWK